MNLDGQGTNIRSEKRGERTTTHQSGRREAVKVKGNLLAYTRIMRGVLDQAKWDRIDLKTPRS